MSIERNLKRICESNGVNATVSTLADAFAAKKIRPGELSIRRMAETFIGSNWDSVLENRMGRVQESADSVSASLFTAITGQLLVNEIKEKYKLASFIGDSLCTTIPVTNGNLGTQKVPYLSDVRDVGEKLEEGEPYPQTQFAGQYITYPGVEKHGRICAVSMEAIFSDLTTQILDSARSVGQYLALTREYKILQVALGITNNHSWNGTSYNTYVASGGSWVNKVATFSLTDWTSINSLEQLFVNMVDPITGYPILIEPKNILVTPAQKYSTRSIVNATEVRRTQPGYATTGGPIQNVSDNPLDRDYQILTSPHALKALTDSGVSAANSNIRVYLGDFQKAFVWREAKPLTIVEAPPLNPMEFNQDIALAVKASWMGVAGVRDPRFVVLGSE
ncbi:hypothetical protein UFOVP829_3 [uncultured Caudovirales phage]|uniref:Uncharacterized protein n=1 Tax=uncultured Caudovirales phage TaxID=2100421 RepID=A0A6J5P2K3_9CAUD|nr:hypothetical protein UFOVP493_35 [uncultured Caudovirales phage]CAB4164156.1 hypothetical protein UFOVP829_3 [uncultured Caudovirales phage]CAB4177608.1 hypothetical protein UFOVP1003_19 [uncultured Caudovirales phage]CAB4187593.1 hypothetical protein UFOVP1153_35 [uncultured Caudovirales phage]